MSDDREKRSANENEQTEPRKKLRFKKTETSRLKKSVPEPPAKAKPAVAAEVPKQPPSAEKDGGDRMQDPMALRDTHTSKVRRVQSGRDTGTVPTAVAPGTADEQPEGKKTETVHLKVVQQKKKEIADMMSPGSTVRLRAPAGAKKAGAKGDEKAPPVPQSETVKVSPPPVPGGTEETATADKTQVPQAVTGKETGTQPLKKVGKPAAGPQETTTLSRPQKPEEAAGEEQAAAPGKPKQTLKLKTGGKAGKTLKVSRGKGESGKTVRVPIKDGGEGTVKVPAPEGAEQPGAPGVPQAAATVAAQPGIGYTFAAVITLAALGAVAVFLVLQLLAHLQ